MQIIYSAYIFFQFNFSLLCSYPFLLSSTRRPQLVRMKEYLLVLYISCKAQRVNASKVRLIFNFSNLSTVSSLPTFQLLLSSSSSISVYKWYTKSVSQWPKWFFYFAMTANKKRDTQPMRRLMQTNQSPCSRT